MLCFIVFLNRFLPRMIILHRNILAEAFEVIASDINALIFFMILHMFYHILHAS